MDVAELIGLLRPTLLEGRGGLEAWLGLRSWEAEGAFPIELTHDQIETAAQQALPVFVKMSRKKKAPGLAAGALANGSGAQRRICGLRSFPSSGAIASASPGRAPASVVPAASTLTRAHHSGIFSFFCAAAKSKASIERK